MRSSGLESHRVDSGEVPAVCLVKWNAPWRFGGPVNGGMVKLGSFASKRAVNSSESKYDATATSQVPTGTAVLLSGMVLTLGAAALLCAIALTVRTYMPCPFWDEWAFVNAIASGRGLLSGNWLWSEHNEHRLLVTRLLILADLRLFGGKNVSLFVEMCVIQALHLAAIWYALERFTTFPRYLRRTLQGVFAFCLFHLNQAENLTWAFQVSFVLAFAVATFAFLAIAFFERMQRPLAAVIAVGLAPLMAGLNVAGGLLIGPLAICFALFRRLPARYIVLIGVLFLAGAIGYTTGYKPPDPSHTPLEAISHPKDLFVYVLTYFGASWTRLLPHKERITCFLSLLSFALLSTVAVRRRDQTSAFEWFCLAECAFTVAVAVLTGLGRLKYGVGQAYAGRYQTPAMLYWASLCALFLIAVWRYRPAKFLAAQASVLLILIASAATFLPIWHGSVAHGDLLAGACDAVMNGNRDERAAKLLYGSRQDVAPGADYLRQLWGK